MFKNYNKTYKVGILAVLLSFFSISSIFGQNSCATALVGTVNIAGTGCSSWTSVLTGTDAANPIGSTAPCAITDQLERWVKFTAIGPTATISVASTSGASAARELAIIVYSGTCGSLTQIGCANNVHGAVAQTETLTLSGLTYTPSTDYYIRIINESTATTFNTNVCITSVPGNDDPSGAFPLTVGSTTACNISSYNNFFATNTNCSPSIPNPSCASYVAGTSQDIWYSVAVVAPGNLTINTSGQQFGLALYSGTNSPGCGTMSEVICTETGSAINPLYAGFSLTGLIPGTYYLRAWKKIGTTAAFNMCATSVPPTPPVNDEPCGATVAVVNSGTTCTTSNTTSIAAATTSTPAPSCAGLVAGVQITDVWAQFTATSSTHSITINSVLPNTAADKKLFIAVYSTSASTCTSGVALAGSELLCGSTTSGTTTPVGYSVSGLTAGQTYLIRFFNWSAAGYTTTINYCITTPTIATNDECSTAFPTFTNTGTSCASFTTGTLFNMTASSQTNGCAVGNDDDDVWYRFVAGSTSHSITINTTSAADFYHSVYAGTCGSLGPAIMCSDPNSSILFGLTVGNTYFVRVYSFGSTALTATTGTFELCINTPSPSAGCVTIPSSSSPNFCSSTNTISISQSGFTYSSTIASDPVSPNYTSDVPGNLGSVFCGSIEGNAWYPFIATATTHTFPIVSVSGCTNGVQAKVFDVGFTGTCCTSFTSMSNCYNPGSTASGSVVATSLTIGNTYWLMVDANGGATACTYSILGWAPTSTLPVEIVSFTGKNLDDVNYLEWITSSETNNAYFTLEHSINGIDFETVSKTSSYGDGNSTSNQIYQTYDSQPNKELTYYRVRQTDKRGQIKTSKIISIIGPDYYETISNIYPNPTSHDLNFEYTSKTKSAIHIELVSYTGNLVYQNDKLVEEGKNHFSIQMDDLNNGVYILKVISEKSGKTTHHKVIKN